MIVISQSFEGDMEKGRKGLAFISKKKALIEGKKPTPKKKWS